MIGIAATALGFVILGNCIFYMILGEVNGRSRSEEEISPWGVNTKLFMVLGRHRQFYPGSKLRKYLAYSLVLALILFVSALVWALTVNS